jgi:phosphate transport system protein
VAETSTNTVGGELESLSASVAHMGGLAESQFAAAIESVARRDSALAEHTVSEDARIDLLEQQIEQKAIQLLALRAPLGQSLRETLSAIKIASDLERIGDLSKNVAKRALVLNQEEPVKLTQSLSRMGRQSLSQLKDVLDAYIERDAEKSLAVWRRDEEIDELYNSLFRELLTYMMEDPRTIGLGTHLLFIAKNIERIGDHATNIAEIVYYLVNGSYLKDERPKGDVTSLTSVQIGNGT